MGATPPPQTAGHVNEPLWSPGHSHTANMRRCHNVSLMVDHRLQHWTSIGLPVPMLAHYLQPWLSSKTALAKRLIFAGVTGNLIH